MRHKQFLYFALGVTTTISLGAITNQIGQGLGPTGLTLSDTSITFSDGTVQTSAAPGRKSYYLTAGGDGGQGHTALTACAAGYHMASIWEIFDPSQLDYDAALGLTRADSGAGPPAGVRVGFAQGTFPTLLNPTSIASATGA